ncbi:MAG: hypothetical protein RLZZ127_660 [Planctomycetota bacterium]|jgi:hypothetical protein
MTARQPRPAKPKATPPTQPAEALTATLRDPPVPMPALPTDSIGLAYAVAYDALRASLFISAFLDRDDAAMIQHRCAWWTSDPIVDSMRWDTADLATDEPAARPWRVDVRECLREAKGAADKAENASASEKEYRLHWTLAAHRLDMAYRRAKYWIDEDPAPKSPPPVPSYCELLLRYPDLLNQPGPGAVLRVLLCDPDRPWSATALAKSQDLCDLLPREKASPRSVGRWLDALAAEGLAQSHNSGTAQRWRFGDA